jgi:hypothetical protein
MCIPGEPRGGHRSKIIIARTEMTDIAVALEAYVREYGHLPIATTNATEDMTFGILPAEIQGFNPVKGTSLIASNSDVIVALMDFDVGVNQGHKLNPLHINFLNAKLTTNTNSHGVSVPDYQYRDPWGNPYIISLDANRDGLVRDAIYAQPDLYTDSTAAPLTNRDGVYELPGKVMAWSRGPDGKVSSSKPASTGVNCDNVLSWR